MPIVYRCRACGHVLYAFCRVGQDSRGVPTPSEVISMYGGRCPRCGRRLEKPGLGDVDVRPLSGGGGVCVGESVSVNVTVRLPERLVEELEKVAREEKKSRGEVVREALMSYLSLLRTSR